MMEKTQNRGEFARLVRGKLVSRGIPLEHATLDDWHAATVLALHEVLEARRSAFLLEQKERRAKRVAYLCMEFLLGRLLPAHLEAVGVCEELGEELARYGYTLEALYKLEVDMGLGNGGLGRLAACFFDSLSALSYPAIGFSLCYEEGLFRQKILDGAQIELADDWIVKGGIHLIPRPEKSVTVRFGGQIEERYHDGRLDIIHTEYDEVRAVPYDILIPGNDGRTVNTLRLFRARDVGHHPDAAESQAGYMKAMCAKSEAEELTRLLYPPDNHEEGKLLRLCQQYFLVSAALSNLISEHFEGGESLATLPDRLAIHLNDTHPALAIPELLRLLLDVHSYSWEDAWSVVQAIFSYTNHTVMPEALECWRVDLFRMKLPRIFSIVSEINRRYTEALFSTYVGDFERISRMAIVAYGQLRMANLSVVGSHTVNGVSRLHSEILKKSVFSDFYAYTKEKFTGVTNGIAHRRWLLLANKGLSALLDEVIGDAYRTDPERLFDLLSYRGDTALLHRLMAIKRENKEGFSRFLSGRGARALDPDAVFDVQIKRLHEYKRQLLNVLRILSLWQELRENPNLAVRPTVFLFGAKAAAGYYMAKELIRLIVALSEELSRDPAVRDMIRVEFCEEYNVTMAEALIPAADISEQISLAGKEASGTGCMKLMMNGALTVGTMDGANVEIAEAVGEENIYIFGLGEGEVLDLWQRGYDARAYYRASAALHAAVDRLYFPIAGRDFSHVADYLISPASGVADPYMCLADFESYRAASARAFADYASPELFAEKSLVNIACSGYFSSDRSIREYAERIWHIKRIKA